MLVPLIVTEDGFDLLFTKRTDIVETHKGQVSFPGGMVDEADAGIVETALREALEEIGLNPEQVTVACLLDDLATPTGFVITPVVGIIRSLPPLRPNEAEVAEVFRVSLEFFADPAHERTEQRNISGKSHTMHFYDHDPHVIWGATAMIIRRLLKRLQ